MQVLKHVTELMLQFKGLVEFVSSLSIGINHVLVFDLPRSVNEGSCVLSKADPGEVFHHIDGVPSFAGYDHNI